MASIKRKLIFYHFWIKELFRFCPYRKSNIDKDHLFLTCGHRGSPVNEPENTIPSLERALSEGANALEVDICVTKDNEVILWHDWNPDGFVALIRENGLEPEVKYKPYFPAPFSGFRNKTSELTLQDFRKYYNYVKKGENQPAGAHIPILAEFIQWISDTEKVKYVFLDVKVPKDEKELVMLILDQLGALVREFNPSCQFIIETSSKEVLNTAKNKYPDLIYCLDVELPPGFVFFPRLHSGIKAAIQNNNSVGLILRPSKITFGNWMTYRRVMRYDVRKRNRFNKKNPDQQINFLIGCTINSKKEMDCLIKKGINGIQTDYPRRLTNIVKEFGLKRE
ncbi:MAG TPA: glycerophosphodiester phosphodiesterase family protein [Ignavibacteriaceae bacterium]|nr:glycerophosphodiester phosphodiesterase family protein [Ignavibacteriaceae bacterium]